ncbi:hypothetical protein Fmac_009259 [Flemingia macrophylla]|uniref:Protein kinase domain-containing protein n=1 Tax=Flemingia macrophylla TaxID=520843 RepID=A0ABD1MZU1_9FABA
MRTAAHVVVLFELMIGMTRVEGRCYTGCDLALASYYVREGINMSYISNLFGRPTSEILKYNPSVKSADQIASETLLRVPFSCDCLNGAFLGHTFSYRTQHGDRYQTIAEVDFSNLTTKDWVSRVNRYPSDAIPDGVNVNVTVNCSCGNRHVSRDYGLFMTYPLRVGDDLQGLAAESGVPAELLLRYNPTVNFTAATALLFLPAKGMSSGAIAGIAIGGAAGILILALLLYVGLQRRKVDEVPLLPVPGAFEDHCSQLHHGIGIGSSLDKTSESSAVASPRLTGITVDKSVEFSYEELAKATDGFSEANIIGQGGFGSVFYAELRNEVGHDNAAIKKMDMQASNEFLAELKVLTHVHHLNLFEEVPGLSDPKEDLRQLVDPRLGDNYPLDSLFKVSQLAKACTHENPQIRPSMRSIVVALMTLSSASEDWDVGSFYENQALGHLMSGR